jgi:hypothetical protein
MRQKSFAATLQAGAEDDAICETVQRAALTRPSGAPLFAVLGPGALRL